MADVIDGLDIAFEESPMPLYQRAEITPAQLQALEREMARLQAENLDLRNVMRLTDERIRWFETAIRLNLKAWKLMLKGKFFLVVAIDEPYFPGVYYLIRGREQEIGRWMAEDQEVMDQAMSEFCHSKRE